MAILNNSTLEMEIYIFIFPNIHNYEKRYNY